KLGESSPCSQRHHRISLLESEQGTVVKAVCLPFRRLFCLQALLFDSGVEQARVFVPDERLWICCM
ncbi:MAG: hypothetical protein AB8E87_08815, partial [Prochlorococcus sp.]